MMSEDPPCAHADAGSDIVELPILDAAYQADPHATLRRIAPPERPIRRIKLPSGTITWILTDVRLARRILKDQRFSKKPPKKGGAQYDSDSHFIFRHMLSMDPPEHTRLRAFVSSFFLPIRIEQHRQNIRATCARLIAGLHDRTEIDLVSEFAKPLSLRTICSIVGIPREYEPMVQHWSELLVKADFEDPSMFPRIGDDMCRYFEELLKRTRSAPNGSIFTHLAEAVDAGTLDKQEMFSMTFLLMNAGYETSANLISSGVLALLRNPSQWSAICSDPSLVTRGVEELLRFESPLQMTTPRFAAADVRIADQTIKEGDMIFVALGAANREGNQFLEPDKLDLMRQNASQHLSFGHGVHYCIGAQLARLEGEIAIAAFSQNFPNARYDESKRSTSWDPGFVVRSLSELRLVLGERPLEQLL